MTVSVLFDAQRCGYKVAIKSWSISEESLYYPTYNNEVDCDLNEDSLFSCGCGCTEFESLGGGSAQCDNCGIEYVFSWDD